MEAMVGAAPCPPKRMDARVLRFNGLAFLELASERNLQEVSAHGYYRLAQRGVYLYRPDRVLEAFLVRDIFRREFFPVTASVRPEGIWHMFSTTSATERWLGIESLGYRAKREAVENAAFDPVPEFVEVVQ